MWLFLITPAADPYVAGWRANHDWAATYGIPAHITVRTPFLPSDRWTDEKITPLLRGFLPLELTLARLEDRPGALVILVEPDDELRRLTDAVSATWPTLPPHKAGRPEPAYHLTVVRTPDPAIRRAAAAALRPHLPLRVVATEAWASEGSPDGLTHAVLARS